MDGNARILGDWVMQLRKSLARSGGVLWVSLMLLDRIWANGKHLRHELAIVREADMATE